MKKFLLGYLAFASITVLCVWLYSTIFLPEGYATFFDATGKQLSAILGILGSFWRSFPVLSAVVYTFVLYWILIVCPLCIAATVITFMEERRAGISRQFAGSWITFIFGLLICFAMFSYHTGENGTSYTFLTIICLILFVLGYPLYFFAWRVFDPEEVAAQRRAGNAKVWAGAANYSYTVTTYSDGSKSDNQASSMAASYIGTLIGVILVAVFMPIITYYRLFRMYLLPRLQMDTWNIFAVSDYAAEDGGGYTVPQEALLPISDPTDCVYARYSGDGFYYMTTDYQGDGDFLRVTYYDGAQERVRKEDTITLSELNSGYQYFADWERRGDFYPCRMQSLDADGITVVYDEDGVVEKIHPISLRFLKKVNPAGCIYAKYSGDNYYYLATIDKTGGDKADVTFYDNVKEKVSKQFIRPFTDFGDNFKAYANWEGKGEFYPCRIERVEPDGVWVVYDEDGVREKVNAQSLKFLEKPDPARCLFARYSGDGCYYRASLDADHGDKATVTFFDGYTEKVSKQDMRSFTDLANSRKAYGNWKQEGTYYPCRIEVIGDGTVTVIYDEDGVKEWLSFQDFRFQ